MPTYRAEVVGSLLRPAYLKQARLDLAADRLSVRQFKQIEDRAGIGGEVLVPKQVSRHG